MSPDVPRPAHSRLPWPLPALATWLVAWLLLALMVPLAASQAWPLAAPWLMATAAGVVLALLPRRASGWRRVFMAGGFPVSAVLSGAAAVPSWAWLLPMGLLLAAYPLRTWHDAPLFPTPAGALHGLADLVPLQPGARVLDAGCGLGHGLAALRHTWPQAQIEGIEWSGALRLAAALRCPWARVRRGDMWADDWQGCAVVYLFQRPESMARAWAKACAELAPGACLVSLAFEVPGLPPTAALGPPGPRRVWIYRMAPGARSATGCSTRPPVCR
ncbi:MAG: class I SAM-dependent methyltransferase [Aquabacterium sp.]|nr:class I SAM-dependent methyltransferase [Aquabacterium sp.]